MESSLRCIVCLDLLRDPTTLPKYAVLSSFSRSLTLSLSLSAHVRERDGIDVSRQTAADIRYAGLARKVVRDVQCVVDRILNVRYE